MRRPRIDLHALCVIARDLLTDEPTMDDSEWRERIKCRLLERGWTYPQTPALIGEAMTRVEGDVSRAIPVPVSPVTARAELRRARLVFPRTPGAAADFTGLADVIAGLKHRGQL